MNTFPLEHVSPATLCQHIDWPPDYNDPEPPPDSLPDRNDDDWPPDS